MMLAPREWRIHRWDHSLWWRTYQPGGYDGYRTITGRRLPCATMATALQRPDMHDEIRRLAARRPRTLRQGLRLRADDTAFRLATWLNDRDHDKAAARLYGLSKRLSDG